jgi:hypothetical protein
MSYDLYMSSLIPADVSHPHAYVPKLLLAA